MNMDNSAPRVREDNLSAVKMLANTLRTTLGPYGMDKMLQDDAGEILVTNDGATILQELSVQHPVASLIVDLSKAQDNEIGDGTTGVVIIISQLLERAVSLIDKCHIHPSVVISGYKLACREAIKFAKANLRRPTSELNISDIEKIASTSLESKLLGAMRANHSARTEALDGVSRFANIIVKAAQGIKRVDSAGKITYNQKLINVICCPGGNLLDSFALSNGMCIMNMRASSNMPTLVLKARVLCINFNLHKERLKPGVAVEVTNPTELEKIRQKECELTELKCKRLISCNPTVIFSTQGIDDLAQKYFLDKGILAVRRVEIEQLRSIARSTGAKIIHSLHGDKEEEDSNIDAQNLGFAERVEEVRLGDLAHIIVEGGVGARAAAARDTGETTFFTEPEAPFSNIVAGAARISVNTETDTEFGTTSTIVLRGPNEFILAEAQRSVHDAVCAVCVTLENKFLSPGGGAIETAIYTHLHKYATTIDSREQSAVEAFADSLLVIPQTLLQNAGLDSWQVLAQLKHEHSKEGGNIMSGVNLRNGTVQDSFEMGVVEPSLSRLRSLTNATETASTILRVDTTINMKVQ